MRVISLEQVQIITNAVKLSFKLVPPLPAQLTYTTPSVLIHLLRVETPQCPLTGYRRRDEHIWGQEAAAKSWRTSGSNESLQIARTHPLPWVFRLYWAFPFLLMKLENEHVWGIWKNFIIKDKQKQMRCSFRRDVGGNMALQHAVSYCL